VKERGCNMRVSRPNIKTNIPDSTVYALDFGPLDDYGWTNIGSTTIRYINEKGEWVE
jgi:hypothetical protein